VGIQLDPQVLALSLSLATHFARSPVERLLAKNQALVGFFLLNYSKLFKRHFEALEAKWRGGELTVRLADPITGGIDAVFDAVDYLQTGASSGKVTLSLFEDLKSKL